MFELLITPLTSGLATGVYCFSYCIPFIAPVMVAEERAWRDNLKLLLKFLAGRFLGYIFFGAAVGLLGQRLDNKILNIVMLVSLIVLSLVMIFEFFGLITLKGFKLCAAPKKLATGFPFLMGLLMGVNICPPFLMSLAFVFELHSALEGIVYFIMFFVGTSVYFIPVYLLGYFNKLEEFRTAGRISALIVGVAFFIYGVYKLWGVSSYGHF